MPLSSCSREIFLLVIDVQLVYVYSFWGVEGLNSFNLISLLLLKSLKIFPDVVCWICSRC